MSSPERGRATHAYLGLKPCGHAGVMFVDDPFDKPWTAGECHRTILEGFTLQRVTLEEARTKGLACSCPPPQHELPLPAAAPPSARGDVFEVPAFLRRGGD